MAAGTISPIDVFDVVAVILGVICSVRRQWVQLRLPEDFPGVEMPSFEAWKRAGLWAYGVLMTACLAKLVLDFAWFYACPALGVGSSSQRQVAMVIDLSWVAAMFWGVKLRARAHRLLRELPPQRATV